MEVSSNYNANLFELKRHDPLKVKTYSPEITPRPKEDAIFYQVLGRVANSLTSTTKMPVISERGQIKILESTLPESELNPEIEIENVGKFEIKLKLVEEQEITIYKLAEYTKLINQIVDVAVTKLSTNYFKYVEKSPFIFERGEGYFDETLRNEIGIEDGTQFYRGIRMVQGIPYLIINRSIELRSLKHLLNELKILGEHWSKIKNMDDFNFYDPPKQFVQYVNWMMRGKTGTIRKYPGPSILINEITWDVRANDNVIGNQISIVELQKTKRGIKIKDENQPLVKWTYVNKEGKRESQYHVPELLVVGHTFQDLSRRISKTKTSQVFDIMHPNCTDQQRKIYDFVRKLDGILRSKFTTIYPSKLEFDITLKNIDENITLPKKISLKLGEKFIAVEPPYGKNFYKKYSATMKYDQPIVRDVKTLAIVSEPKESEFIKNLEKEFEKRNGTKLIVDEKSELDLDKDAQSYDLIITIADDTEYIENCKRVIVNQNGKCHQNMNKINVKKESIPQLAMNITLKLGGYPWILDDKMDLQVLSILSYTNPFDSTRFYLFNIMTSAGTLIYQSKPFHEEEVLDFLRTIREKVKDIEKLLVLITFNHEQIEEYISKELSTVVNEYLLLMIRKKDHLRIFKTFKTPSTGRRRRRTDKTTYPLEAYEESPQGLVLKTGDREFYLVTTASMNIGTYSRGCPLPIKVNVLDSKGLFDINDVIGFLLSLCMVAGTSGHVTRQPAPIYYLGLLGTYLNKYGTPTNDSTYETLFYV